MFETYFRIKARILLWSYIKSTGNLQSRYITNFKLLVLFHCYAKDGLYIYILNLSGQCKGKMIDMCKVIWQNVKIYYETFIGNTISIPSSQVKSGYYFIQMLYLYHLIEGSKSKHCIPWCKWLPIFFHSQSL